MPQIMADNNVQGQLKAIIRFLRSETWQEFWEGAAITVVSFTGLGLDRDAPDLAVWQACQARGVVLFTGNRNQQGPDSLEETIRTLNQAESLPVITLGDPIRFVYDRDYAERAALRLLDYLLDLDQHRGAGRLYVP
jgi:Tfp pilus assembly pilus retraction ATPase PilT